MRVPVCDSVSKSLLGYRGARVDINVSGKWLACALDTGHEGGGIAKQGSCERAGMRGRKPCQGGRGVRGGGER